jgi:uncharacterized membrane protein YoaK (UPF0700 family)
VSLRQRLCPERILSRVNATMRFLMMGTFPLGALLGGVLGELVGLRFTLWVSLGIVAVAVAPVHRQLRGTRDVEELPEWTVTDNAPTLPSTDQNGPRDT